MPLTGDAFENLRVPNSKALLKCSRLFVVFYRNRNAFLCEPPHYFCVGLPVERERYAPQGERFKIAPPHPTDVGVPLLLKHQVNDLHLLGFWQKGKAYRGLHFKPIIVGAEVSFWRYRTERYAEHGAARFACQPDCLVIRRNRGRTMLSGHNVVSMNSVRGLLKIEGPSTLGASVL